jgi:hypothetical protein
MKVFLTINGDLLQGKIFRTLDFDYILFNDSKMWPEFGFRIWVIEAHGEYWLSNSDDQGHLRIVLSILNRHGYEVSRSFITTFNQNALLFSDETIFRLQCEDVQNRIITLE